MGSKSDLPVISESSEILRSFEVTHETLIVSAHRTPEKMFDYAKSAESRGIRVIIAGAGGAAHLPGMTASLTSLPVIGVPIRSTNSIDGWDSILSILQMPTGTPVATVALNQAKNAALLAIKILALNDTELAKKMKSFLDQQKQKVIDEGKSLS